MSLDALLAKLEARTVTPVTDAPSHDVTPEPLQILGCTAVTSVTAESIITAMECPLEASNMHDFYEERAAILEYDGGLSRSDAEAQAFAELQTWRNQRTYH